MSACEWRVGDNSGDEVRIVERGERDGVMYYAVKWRGWTANRDREWEYEPIPSGRDDDYFARCRFEEWEEAALIAQHMAHEVLSQTVAPASARTRTP